MTAVDFAPSAVDRARVGAAAANVTARFLVDDITAPTRIPDGFELLAWESALTRVIPIGNISVAPGDTERFFGPHWTVDRVLSNSIGRWPRRSATYLMSRDVRKRGQRVIVTPPA